MRREMILAAALAFLASAAQAAEANRCTVSVTPVQFGTYNGLEAFELRSTGMLTYNCIASTPVTITLNRGNAPSFDARQMSQGAYDLFYNLYLDAAGTVVWGDGTGGSQAYRDPSPPPDTNVSVPIYGRVPAHQRGARVGIYDDNLVVTITY